LPICLCCCAPLPFIFTARYALSCARTSLLLRAALLAPRLAPRSSAPALRERTLRMIVINAQ